MGRGPVFQLLVHDDLGCGCVLDLVERGELSKSAKADQRCRPFFPGVYVFQCNGRLLIRGGPMVWPHFGCRAGCLVVSGSSNQQGGDTLKRHYAVVLRWAKEV